ncbi:MAG: ATP-dependent zinc metalloprotease FtsH [Firmicutes bacterium]|nr:ATP-dependent zinc metalloprotease FtsH [Bacillota bacterium]
MNENNINNDSNDNNSNRGNDISVFIKLLLFAVMLTFIINAVRTYYEQRTTAEITYSRFLEWIDKDYIDNVVFKSDQIVITLKSDAKPENTQNPSGIYRTGYIENDELIPLLLEKNIEFSTPVVYNSPVLAFIVAWVLPLLLFFFIFRMLTRALDGRMGGVMGVGKANAKVYMEHETGVTFEDVAGQDEAKESLVEIIDFLHDPDKYSKIGAKQPKGALLVGPPGTGKTLLAKAVAGEAKVTFLSLSGSDFVEMFVGVGASRVRDLFKQAQESAPSIVFIDEIDAIGKSRDNQIGGNDEREQTLNQLLSEMDGFDTSKGIVILAATNRPEVLDKALLRPGRFDRRIIVEKPDLIGREKILKVHAKNVKIGSDVDFNKIALATSGAVGADLANMVNEAALRAVRMGRDEVKQEDLLEAVEVVIAGKEKKDRILSDKEKEIVAYHEIGHALAAALQKNTQPVQKITIVPRTMGALGYTMQMPEEEKYLMSKDEMLAEIVVLLAGRAAEEVKFNSITTGASNDIERATAMARAMISQYGMSERFDMMQLESIQNRYLDGRAVTNCGEQTIAVLDGEVLELIKKSHKKAVELISSQREALDELSSFLIKRETITGEEFMDILKKYTEPEEETVKTAIEDNEKEDENQKN